MTEWMKQVNQILRRHRIAYDGILIRFGATKYPSPSIAVVVYENGEKIGEFAIRNLAEFIADLNTVYSIIRTNISEVQTENRESDSDEVESEERSETNNNRRRFRKKAPKRD